MSGPMLKVTNLEVRYGDLIGVADVSLEVPKGGVVALLGSNGAGKTTTLNAIAGIDPASKGDDHISRRATSPGCPPTPSCARAWRSRRKAGGFSCSRPSRTTCCSAPRRSSDKHTMPALLDRVYEIFPKLAERRLQRAGTMSGGERQMLAVGRALMSDPKLLMLDEPSLGLAPTVVESMYETFGQLHREGLTILLAEQSIELALEVSDFATVLQVGKSVLSGTAAALANDPQVQKAYLGG